MTNNVPPYIDNLFYMAATPDGIPKAIMDKYWGFLNHSLAQSNLEKTDILEIKETLKQRELLEMMHHTEDQLADKVDQDPDYAIDQIGIIATCLSSLGKNGFLIRQSKTQSSIYEVNQKSSPEKGSKVLDFFTPKKQEAESR